MGWGGVRKGLGLQRKVEPRSFWGFKGLSCSLLLDHASRCCDLCIRMRTSGFGRNILKFQGGRLQDEDQHFRFRISLKP